MSVVSSEEVAYTLYNSTPHSSGPERIETPAGLTTMHKSLHTAAYAWSDLETTEHDQSKRVPFGQVYEIGRATY